MVCRVVVVLVSCLLALPVVAGDGLWEWVTPLPQGHSLLAAAFGNGVVVAVGAKGTVITSTDGDDWTITRTGADCSLRDVVWGNGRFVAVGSYSGWEFNPVLGVILTSDNGVDWIERYRTESQTVDAVVWTGSRFVAVGVADKVLLSSDGTSWSEQPTGSEAWTMTDLAWNGSMLAAIGSDNVPWFGHHSYFTSENGEEWALYPLNRDFAPESVAAAGGRFVAVGSEHDVLVSDDGLTWTAAPYESPSRLEVIVDGGDQFLATGRDVVATSPDGYVWTIEDLSTESQISGLAWSGDGYLAVGEDGFLMSSPEGFEWTQLSENSLDLTGSWEINELAMNASTIVGVGDGAVIITGNHSTEWVRRYSPANFELTGVIWAGSAFWTVGRERIMRSTDGVHWAEMLFDPGIYLFDIEWNGSVFVAVGMNASHTQAQKLILTSADGHEWSGRWFDIEDHFFTVGWTGSDFVAAGRGSIYLTSADGLNWEQQTMPEGVTLLDMTWNGDRLVAVGGRSDSGGVVFSTGDGTGWLESVLPEPAPSWFEDVTWTGTHFVAVSRSSGDVIFYSPDGIIWSSETTGTGVWPVSVVGDEHNLYVTGRGLDIIRRTAPLADPEPPRRSGRRVSPAPAKARAERRIQR
jgi:hypothetical protein